MYLNLYLNLCISKEKEKTMMIFVVVGKFTILYRTRACILKAAGLYMDFNNGNVLKLANNVGQRQSTQD